MIKKQRFIALTGLILTSAVAFIGILFGIQPGYGEVNLSIPLVVGVLSVLTFPTTFLFWLIYTYKQSQIFKILTILFALLSFISLIYIFQDQL